MKVSTCRRKHYVGDEGVFYHVVADELVVIENKRFHMEPVRLSPPTFESLYLYDTAWGDVHEVGVMVTPEFMNNLVRIGDA